MDYSSKLLENAINEMAQLPGIGKSTALRLLLHLLKRPEEQSLDLAKSLIDLRTKIKFCKTATTSVIKSCVKFVEIPTATIRSFV